ncbi:MAG: TIM-barrel domain-containing protein, partial [Bacteroidia bacterium]
MEYIQPAKVDKAYPSNFKKLNQEKEKIILETENSKLEVSVYSDSIIRFRYTPGRFEQDFSYAIKPGLTPLTTGYEVEESELDVIITTHLLKVYINKENLKVTIYNHENVLLNEDDDGFHFEKNQAHGGNYVYCSKKIQKNECFYGLGDKTTDLNLRGKRLINWCTEFYGFHKNIDPLYKAIPFFYGLHNKIGYGIFFDNSFKSFFDFGNESSNVNSFWAEGGELNYYFIYGPSLTEVAEKYTTLTGVPEMPPLWSLGYHQSKWSYYPESMVKEITHQFRDREIPCDVIHFDIDYMDGFRCFTWDKDRFPEPAALLENLEKNGFKSVVIIDPGIKIDPDYWVYKEGVSNRFFCRRPDGDFVTGKVWPGDCHFPDFTNPEVREWWANLFNELVNKGVDGVWNDMNEPSIFEITTFPNDVRHNHEGLKVSHRRGHNVYGMQMARATYEGRKKNNPEKRPFVISRAGYAGVQRFSSVWTGDNVSNWDHIWMGNIQCQRLSISGISFCGSDIGGFLGEPNGELFLRYIQSALFHPFFRAHSSSDQGDKEPWAFGKKYELLIKQVIELRYRLLPYLYTAFYQYVNKGTPILRSL